MRAVSRFVAIDARLSAAVTVTVAAFSPDPRMIWPDLAAAGCVLLRVVPWSTPAPTMITWTPRRSKLATKVVPVATRFLVPSRSRADPTSMVWRRSVPLGRVMDRVIWLSSVFPSENT